MSLMASQITSLTIVYSTVYSDADQRKLQSSASLAFVRGIHRGPVNSPHKRPVTRKMFPFDDVIMKCTPGMNPPSSVTHKNTTRKFCTCFFTKIIYHGVWIFAVLFTDAKTKPTCHWKLKCWTKESVSVLRYDWCDYTALSTNVNSQKYELPAKQAFTGL